MRTLQERITSHEARQRVDGCIRPCLSSPCSSGRCVIVVSRQSQQAASLTDAQRSAVTALVRLAPVVDDLANRFVAAGRELALVGGSVRDALLGRLGHDLDLTTDAPPRDVIELAEDWADAVWTIGIDFGTVGLRKGDYTLEITTYRAESYDPESRKPEVQYGQSLDEDLSRRDFTVNAMAVRLPRHEFVDPYGGLDDLAARTLRAPARTEDLFDDDPLRMMRAARFAAQLNFTVAPEVVAAMTAMAGRIEIVSAERVRDELVRLVCGDHPRRGITLLVDTGLADRVLPEVPKMRLETDEHHRHKDVYEHSLTVLEQAIDLEPPDESADIVLRFAALLHDIGKPKTRAFEPRGGVTFHHHEVVGAKLARKRLSALRFSKGFTSDVCRLIELHLRFHGYGSGEWTDSAVRRYVRDAGHVLPQLHRLVRSDCTTRNRRKAQALARAYDHLEERIERLQQQEELAKIRPDLDGNEIMEILGIQPGPLVGRAYRHLLDLRMEHGPLGRDAAADELRRWAADQG